MASLLDLENRIKDLFSQAGSHVAQSAKQIRSFAETPKPFQIPTFQTNYQQFQKPMNDGQKLAALPQLGLQIGKTLANVPINAISGLANETLNTSSDTARILASGLHLKNAPQTVPQYTQLKSGIGKLGYNIASLADPKRVPVAPLKIKNTPQEILGNYGQAVGAYAPFASGVGLTQKIGTGSLASQDIGFLKTVGKGAVSVLPQGFMTGLATGLDQNRGDKYLTDQIIHAAKSGVITGTQFAVLGGVVAGGKYAVDIAKARAITNYYKTQHDANGFPLSDQQAGMKGGIDFQAPVGGDPTQELLNKLAKQGKLTPEETGQLLQNPGIKEAYDKTMAANPVIKGVVDRGIAKGDTRGILTVIMSKMSPETRAMVGDINRADTAAAGREIRGSAIIPAEPEAGLWAKIKNPGTYFDQPQGQAQGLKGGIDFQAPISLGEKTGARERGFVTSVKESPTLKSATIEKAQGVYVPKQNDQLMGEAKALLNDGASLNFKSIKNVDQKVSATIQQAINLDKSGDHEAAANLFNNLSAQGTELGRGVQAFSLLNKMSPEAVSLSAAGKIRTYNATHTAKIPELTGDQQATISDMVDSIRKMADGRDKNIAINQLQQTISDFIPSSLADKAITVWKAGLLTSLRTHERNLLGNSIMGGAEIAKDPFATAADKVMSLKTGQRTQTSTLQGLGEFASQATRQQVKDGAQLGFDPSNQIEKFDVKQINWGNNPVEQILKKYTDVVFRTLSVEDRPFWNSAYARSLYDQAGAEAINAGKQGDTTFIQKLVDEPSETMLKTAFNDANYATFHDKNVLSGVANAIKQAAQDPKLGKLAEIGKVTTEVLAPFTGVPSSIVGKTIAYSPLGLVRGAMDVGRVLTGQVPELQRQAAQEIGRGVIGTGLFSIGAYLMSKGLMTGQPKDTTEANLWAAQGKQANSVLIGGKWRSINSIGPQNLVLLAGAKYQEEMGKPDGNVGAYAGGLAKDQLSQTFLAGVQGPLNAISDPARFGQIYVGGQMASTIPTGIKDIAKAGDPYQRENNTTLDYVTNSLPYLRNKNIEKRDVLGNIMPQEPSGVNAFFDLLNSKTPINSPVLNELSRLNDVGQSATPSKLGKGQTINGVKSTLTPQELNTLEATVGPQVRQALDKLIANPSYKALSDEDKATAIGNVVKQVRKQVKGTIDINAPIDSQIKNTSSTNGSGAYTIINPDTGAVKTIDLSQPITKPVLTGNTELDKKLNAKYNSDLSSRATDITTLYTNKQISAADAEKMLQDLLNQKIAKGKKPAKVSLLKPKASHIKIGKIKMKGTKIKSLVSNIKVKAHIAKAKQTNLPLPKASFSYKIKRPQLKGLQQGARIA